MKSRPCGSTFGSVRPSFRPGVWSRVNRFFSGTLPSAMALNWLADLLLGLYATTIEAPAYWMYQFGTFGSRRGGLSLPTLWKTFGWISPAAMSDSRVPEALA